MRWGDVERNCAGAISPVPEKLSSNDLDVPIEVRRKPSRFGPSLNEQRNGSTEMSMCVKGTWA
jgi:hypothetical protein